MKNVDDDLISEATPIIHKLASSRSSNGSFAYFEDQDIYQEIWRMCLDALKRYDRDKGPIENYLVRHVTNRMRNLRRDRYFRPGYDMSTSGLAKTRMDLVNALSIDESIIDDSIFPLCSSAFNIDPLGLILCEETIIYIQGELSGYLLESFNELLGNNHIRKPILEELREKIAEILSREDEDVG